MRARAVQVAALVVGLLGLEASAHAQWSDSFTDLGVSYTVSDLTVGLSTTHTYSLVLDTTGYSGPADGFLDSVNIKAWSGTDVSFALLSAPGGATAWSTAFGPISNGGTSGCGGSSAGFACVEAITKGEFAAGMGAPLYTFLFEVAAASADVFYGPDNLSDGVHVGAGYANALGAGPRYGITSTVMAPIPEPSSYALMLAGLGLLAFVKWRRRRGMAPTACG